MDNKGIGDNSQIWSSKEQKRDANFLPNMQGFPNTQGFQGGPDPSLSRYQPSMSGVYLSEQKQDSSNVTPPMGGVINKTPLFKGSKLNSYKVLIGIGIILLLLLGGAFFIMKGLTSSPDVTLYQVGVQNMNQSVGGGGIVFPLQQLSISYPINERVVSIFVKPGDTVTRGQPLIGLDPAQLNIQIKQASDAVDAAIAYLQSVQASGNSVSIAQAQQQYNLAKGRYDALVAQSASPLLKNANIISPMNGVITEVDINPGEVFAANMPLLTVMDESSIIVRVKIPLANFNQVHVGQSAIVSPSALPNLNITGSVVSVIPQADAQTDTFEVWVQVKNPDKSLLPGMSAFVRIESHLTAMAIPRIAVLAPGEESNVFVVNKKIAYMRNVHIVGRSIDMIFIDSGVSKGDKVVLVGINGLKNGQQVRISKIVSQNN